MASKKIISSIVSARLMAEGVGASVRRSIGSRTLRQFSPFLLLDFMETANPQASFPDHPHRGLETVTYVLQGTIEHEDFTGSKGTLGPGDCQIMTAGRGIMHAEVPKPPQTADHEFLPATGIQLWVDLPADLKNIDPRYRDIRRDTIPMTQPAAGVELYALSKETSVTKTPIWFLYYKFFGGHAVLETPPIPQGWSSFLYVTRGQLTVLNGRQQTEDGVIDGEETLITGDKVLNEHELATFERNNEVAEPILVDLTSPDLSDEEPVTEFLVCAGQPLEQPVFRDMFFVELSKEDLRQSKTDYQEKINGFERGREWKSKIAGAIDYKFTYKTK